MNLNTHLYRPISQIPTQQPTSQPTLMPTAIPTHNPTPFLSASPTDAPTVSSPVTCAPSEICQCPSTSECIFNCEGEGQCVGTELSTTYNGQTITINCIGASACSRLTGDLSPSSSVTWNCKGADACKDAYLDSCGFVCEVNCNCESDCVNEKSCGNDYLTLINPDNSFTCKGLFCITPDPTLSPFTDPTTSPTTSKPSYSPIADGEPTKAPSVPTSSPFQKPIKSPTDQPSSSPTLESTINPISSLIEPEEERIGGSTVKVESLAGDWIKQNVAFFILFIVGILSLCCVPIIICIYCDKAKKTADGSNMKKEPDNIIMKSQFLFNGAVDCVASVESVPSPSSVNSHQNLPQQPHVQNNENWEIRTSTARNSMYNDSDSDASFHGTKTQMATSTSPYSSGGHGYGPKSAEQRRNDMCTTWNYEQIGDWILLLHNGLFRKYEAELRQSLKECNLKGRSLKLVNSDDIRDWGIKDFEHRKLLQYYLNELINTDTSLEMLTVEGNV